LENRQKADFRKRITDLNPRDLRGARAILDELRLEQRDDDRRELMALLGEHSLVLRVSRFVWQPGDTTVIKRGR
jgi:hypothetical protein